MAVPLFVIDPQVNIVDVLSILVTIIAAIVLGVFIDKRKVDSRSMKDLFIAKVAKIEEVVGSLEVKTSTGTFVLEHATSHLKRIHVLFSDLHKRLAENEITESIGIEDEFLTNLRILKNRLTKTPSNDVVDRSINVVENQVTLDEARLALAKTDFDKLESNLFQLQLLINRS